MPRKAKTAPRTNAQIKRDLHKAQIEIQRWMNRTNDLTTKNFEIASSLENAHRKLLVKDIEIGRMQGYIDRVLDEERGRQGTAQNGPTTDTLQRLRHEVLEGSHSLDEMSTDEIERLTGRDD